MTSFSPTIPPSPPCSSTRPSPACLGDEVPEVRSLGNTVKRWRSEILAHHETGASNGPQKGLNLCVKKVKRAGHGFASFRPLPPPGTPSRRWCHLAVTTEAAEDPIDLSHSHA